MSFLKPPQKPGKQQKLCSKATGAASDAALRYEANRKRPFVESWKDKFEWLEYNDGTLFFFCTVCNVKEFPALADT